MIAALVLAAPHALGGSALPRPVGSYGPVSTTNREVVQAARFAVAAQQRLIQAATGEPSARLLLVRVDAAEQQVVAGVNYRLRLTVTLNHRQRAAEAEVWWQAWRTPDPHQLTAWRWR